MYTNRHLHNNTSEIINPKGYRNKLLAYIIPFPSANELQMIL